MKYLGLIITVEDNATGAQAGFHRIASASIDLLQNYSMVTLQAYASQATFEAGKLPVGVATVVLPSAKNGTLSIDDTYEQLKSIANGVNNQPNPYNGAELATAPTQVAGE